MNGCRTTSSTCGSFVTITESGSLAEAARRLDVTPSAVSQRLRQLETRLGMQLAHRSTRRFALTEEGELFYAGASRCWTSWTAWSNAAGASGEVAGTLNVCGPLGFGRRISRRRSPTSTPAPETDGVADAQRRGRRRRANRFDMIVHIGEPARFEHGGLSDRAERALHLRRARVPGAPSGAARAPGAGRPRLHRAAREQRRRDAVALPEAQRGGGAGSRDPEQQRRRSGQAMGAAGKGWSCVRNGTWPRAWPPGAWCAAARLDVPGRRRRGPGREPRRDVGAGQTVSWLFLQARSSRCRRGGRSSAPLGCRAPDSPARGRRGDKCVRLQGLSMSAPTRSQAGPGRDRAAPAEHQARLPSLHYPPP